jgi:hypothetical protein
MTPGVLLERHWHGLALCFTIEACPYMEEAEAEFQLLESQLSEWFDSHRVPPLERVEIHLARILLITQVHTRKPSIVLRRGDDGLVEEV